jgi:hypothetical protein
MTANSFAQRWTNKEIELGLDSISRGFVECAGVTLPRSAAPFLNFDNVEVMPRVFELYGRPTNYSDEERHRLAGCGVIGSDGGGNPICVDDSSGSVWLLDHDDRFRSRLFVNSSVTRLAEFLLLYMGEDNEQRFRDSARRLDAPAFADESFWSGAAECLSSEYWE